MTYKIKFVYRPVYNEILVYVCKLDLNASGCVRLLFRIDYKASFICILCCLVARYVRGQILPTDHGAPVKCQSRLTATYNNQCQTLPERSRLWVTNQPISHRITYSFYRLRHYSASWTTFEVARLKVVLKTKPTLTRAAIYLTQGFYSAYLTAHIKW